MHCKAPFLWQHIVDSHCLPCYTPHAQESGDNSQSSMQQSSTGDVNMREMGQGPLIDRLKEAAQKSKQAVEQHKAGGGGGQV